MASGIRLLSLYLISPIRGFYRRKRKRDNKEGLFRLFSLFLFSALCAYLYPMKKKNLSCYHPSRRSPIRFLICLCINSIFSLSANIPSADPKIYYEEVVEIFLKGFSSVAPQAEEEDLGRKKYGAKIMPFSDRETMKTVMQHIYGNNPLVKKMLAHNEHIVNAMTLKELSVIIGPEGSSHTMINSLDTKEFPHTAGLGLLAQGVWLTKLSLPTTNRKEIERLQQIIRILEENPRLRHALLRIFHRFRPHEKNFVELYNPRHATRTPQQKKFLSMAYASGKKLDQTAIWRLEFNKRWGLDFSLLYVYLFSIPMFFARIYYQFSSWIGFYLMSFILGQGKIPVHPVSNLKPQKSKLEHFSGNYDLVSSIMSIFSIPHMIRRFYYIHKDNHILLAKVFLHQQKWVEMTQEVYQTIQQEKKLARLCKELLTYTSSFIKDDHGDRNLSQLLHLLKTQRLDRFSIFLSSSGKLLKTVGLYEEHGHKLHPAIYEVAFIEVLANLAHYKVHTEQQKNRLCYSCFVDSKEKKTPFLHFKGLWNSGIHYSKAVPNDVFMDGKNYNCALIFGPNAGGKTSFITALRSILLSQTVGLDFAQEATHSIFHVLLTYFYIKGSVVKGLSQYTAEITHIEQVMDILDRLDPDKMAIFLGDELVTGTSHNDAADILYELLDLLPKRYSNTAFFVITHYDLLKTLTDKNEKIKNFRVVIHRDEEGEIIYTYKVVPGTPTTKDSIGIAILEKWPRFAEIAKKAKKRSQKKIG